MKTCWMHEDPCPRCDGMTLATNGNARWCVDPACGYAIHITRRKAAVEMDPDRAREDRDERSTLDQRTMSLIASICPPRD